ncbi:MAG TPA: hypothetical protein VL401_02650 [Alphaproteobacteria bacterium]|nr:hypothetical protein [Alphaproteobacteria bacterium]
MNNKLILKKVKKLYALFHEGKIPTLPQHEVNPNLPKDSKENYLYFTLPPCLNFQRSSPAMWISALATYKDPETKYLFFPELVVKQTREKIQSDLVKHKLALQKNKHTDIWIAVSKAFNEYFDSDPRELFKQNDWDVIKIQKVIQIDKKKNFPYLSGPKMANYWLYILSHYTGANFKNMQEISIIPDTHVLQSTVQLGLSDNLPDPLTAAKLWKELLSGSDIVPVQMHPVLWNWSRNNFKPEV